MQEIEQRTRLRNEDVDRVSQLLADLDFKFVGSWMQTDVTFDRPDASLFNSGCKIRIRRENGEMELTYKSSNRERTDVSVRTETNIRISADQFDACSVLLEALGYPELFRVVKERQVWKRDAVKVTIDDWPIIGLVMEMEGPESELLELSSELGRAYHFENYLLRDFFKAVQEETGKSLFALQLEYESEHDIKLGRLDLLAARSD
jgi:predicted adenylyl cyclase CyaB